MAKKERIDRARVATILIDAYQVGELAAAKRWGITDRTIRNYKTRLETDTELSRAFHEKKARVEADWLETSRRFLSRSIAKLEELVHQAGTDQIREVAGAIKIVGELDVVRSALGGQQPQRPDPSEAAPPSSGASRNGDSDSAGYLQ